MNSTPNIPNMTNNTDNSQNFCNKLWNEENISDEDSISGEEEDDEDNGVKKPLTTSVDSIVGVKVIDLASEDEESTNLVNDLGNNEAANNTQDNEDSNQHNELFEEGSNDDSQNGQNGNEYSMNSRNHDLHQELALNHNENVHFEEQGIDTPNDPVISTSSNDDSANIQHHQELQHQSSNSSTDNLKKPNSTIPRHQICAVRIFVKFLAEDGHEDCLSDPNLVNEDILRRFVDVMMTKNPPISQQTLLTYLSVIKQYYLKDLGVDQNNLNSIVFKRTRDYVREEFSNRSKTDSQIATCAHFAAFIKSMYGEELSNKVSMVTFEMLESFGHYCLSQGYKMDALFNTLKQIRSALQTIYWQDGLKDDKQFHQVLLGLRSAQSQKQQKLKLSHISPVASKLRTMTVFQQFVQFHYPNCLSDIQLVDFQVFKDFFRFLQKIRPPLHPGVLLCYLRDMREFYENCCNLVISEAKYQFLVECSLVHPFMLDSEAIMNNFYAFLLNVKNCILPLNSIHLDDLKSYLIHLGDNPSKWAIVVAIRQKLLDNGSKNYSLEDDENFLKLKELLPPDITNEVNDFLIDDVIDLTVPVEENGRDKEREISKVKKKRKDAVSVSDCALALPAHRCHNYSKERMTALRLFLEFLNRDFATLIQTPRLISKDIFAQFASYMSSVESPEIDAGRQCSYLTEIRSHLRENYNMTEFHDEAWFRKLKSSCKITEKMKQTELAFSIFNTFLMTTPPYSSQSFLSLKADDVTYHMMIDFSNHLIDLAPSEASRWNTLSTIWYFLQEAFNKSVLNNSLILYKLKNKKKQTYAILDEIPRKVKSIQSTSSSHSRSALENQSEIQTNKSHQRSSRFLKKRRIEVDDHDDSIFEFSGELVGGGGGDPLDLVEEIHKQATMPSPAFWKLNQSPINNKFKANANVYYDLTGTGKWIHATILDVNYLHKLVQIGYDHGEVFGKTSWLATSDPRIKLLDDVTLNHRGLQQQMDNVRDDALVIEIVNKLKKSVLSVVEVDAEKLILEYCRYLKLQTRLNFLPCKLIDAIWQEHILHMQEYFHYCKTHFDIVIPYPQDIDQVNFATLPLQTIVTTWINTYGELPIFEVWKLFHCQMCQTVSSSEDSTNLITTSCCGVKVCRACYSNVKTSLCPLCGKKLKQIFQIKINDSFVLKVTKDTLLKSIMESVSKLVGKKLNSIVFSFKKQILRPVGVIGDYNFKHGDIIELH